MKKLKNIIRNRIKRIIDWFDPYHQSFLFLPWSFVRILVVVLLCAWLTKQTDYSYEHPLTAFGFLLRDNPILYLVNYLIHEMLGHNFVGKILHLIFYPHPIGRWLRTFAGNGVETLLPLSLYFGALRLQGGRWLTPLLLYWLSYTLIDAGIYASDATACSFPLTFSDMLTNAKAGSGVCGDWHNLLQPLGLLPYDQWIAGILVGSGMFCFIIAIWSMVYYIFHAEEDLKNSRKEEF